MIVQCAYCGKDVKRKPSAVKRYPISYCDKSCKIKAELHTEEMRAKARPKIQQSMQEYGDSIRAYKICSWCGKEFRGENARQNTRKTCSQDCENSWNTWMPRLSWLTYHAEALLYVHGNEEWIKALIVAKEQASSRMQSARTRLDPWKRKLQAIVSSVKKRHPASKTKQKRIIPGTWEECFSLGIKRLNQRARNGRRNEWQRKFATMERNQRRRFRHHNSSSSEAT